MIVTISQPRYLPWLGYFHRIAACDLFIYLDTVQYTQRDWENRNKIKTNQGWTWLTVPVKAAYLASIPEVRVSDTQPWQMKHWKTMTACYSKAPHFRSYENSFKEIYEDRVWHGLTDLNVSSTQILCHCLGLPNTRFALASEIGATGKGSELLLNLCKAVGATAYLSGCEGRNYLDEQMFSRENIRLFYQDYAHPRYPQLYGNFLPYMSVVDLLFNCGPESLQILLKNQQEVRS